MSSNVHALEPIRMLHGSRPGRDEVEAAVRTILRWTGENPDRDGLVETPARVTRALEESFVGYTVMVCGTNSFGVATSAQVLAYAGVLPAQPSSANSTSFS